MFEWDISEYLSLCQQVYSFVMGRAAPELPFTCRIALSPRPVGYVPWT